MRLDRVVIDTNVASLVWRGQLPPHVERLLGGRVWLITPVTMGEAVQGAYQAGWPRGRLFDQLDYYERAFELLPWHTAIPYSYGMLSGLTRRRGVTVGDNDCWIAAWCVAYRLPLVTMNRRHFEPLLDYGLELEP